MNTVTGSMKALHHLDGRVKTVILFVAIIVAVILRHWYLAAGLWLAITVHN